MTDNPWAAWLREQEGAQVLPGGAAAAGPAAVDAPGDDGHGEEFRGGPFGWDLPPQPRRSGRHLLLAAAALWVLLLVAGVSLLTRPDAGGDTAVATAEVAEPLTDGSGAAGTPTDPAVTLTGPVADEGTAGAAAGGSGAVPLWPDGGEPPPAGATAAGEAGALLVRATLGAPPGPGGSARYVDAAVVTGVEPAGAAQVVTVLALVLTGDGQGWDAATVERHAVAVGRDPAGSYHALAGPWPLAPPATPGPATGTPETDPERLALAAAALEGAGYRDLADLSLLHDAAHPGALTAQVTATAPGAAGPAPWTLWLRDTDEPTLLGTG